MKSSMGASDTLVQGSMARKIWLRVELKAVSASCQPCNFEENCYSHILRGKLLERLHGQYTFHVRS